MARASVWLLVCASAVLSAALIPNPHGRFYFAKPLPSYFWRSGDQDCRICYGEDCLTLGDARCAFYAATSELLQDSEDEGVTPQAAPDIRAQVDKIMLRLVDQALSPPIFMDCIPLISEYTDCSKENVCLGCKKCNCDANGSWNCSVVQQCQAEAALNVDHHTLVAVMEALRSDDRAPVRVRRSPPMDRNGRKKTYEELSQWMFGANPFEIYEVMKPTATSLLPTFYLKPTTTETTDKDVAIENNKVIETTADTIHYVTKEKYKESTKYDTDYLAFDDVLKNNGLEGKICSRRKPLNSHNDTAIDHDYYNFDYTNITFNNDNNLDAAGQFINMLNDIVYQDSVTVSRLASETSTEVIIDLFEAARHNINVVNTTGTTDFKDISDNSIDLRNATFENTNDVNDFNFISIMKRDVSKVNITELQPSSNDKVVTNLTKNSKKTKENKLYTSNLYTSFNKIIKDKQRELNELLNLKGKLIEFLKGNKSEDVSMNVSEGAMKANITNAYFSFYNIDIVPNSFDDFRRSDMDKNLGKLRLDILNVIRDILEIQKIVGTRNFPPELKNLVRAMRHYVHNAENIHAKIKKKKSRKFKTAHTRRHLINAYPMNKDLVKRYLVDILQYIDIDMPQANALASLSTKSKEIMKRVIKNHYFIDDYVSDVPINDFQYNFTNDLSIVGLKWKQMTFNIFDSSPENKLYCVKLLYFLLMSDITKITDALKVMEFMSSRRLALENDELSEKELKRINSDLEAIHTKVNRLLQFQAFPKNTTKLINIDTRRQPNKKETLLKHIRNLLKNSKTDIVNLLRQKVPKSEIVKELAQKKLNDLTNTKLIEYTNVMQKWQKSLDVNSRNRRSAFNFEKLKTRINSILPKYLRGKVHSGIHNSTKGKKKHQNQKQSHKNHNNHNKVTNQSQTNTVNISTTRLHNETKS